MKNKGLKILLSVLLVLCIIMAGALIGKEYIGDNIKEADNQNGVDVVKDTSDAGKAEDNAVDSTAEGAESTQSDAAAKAEATEADTQQSQMSTIVITATGDCTLGNNQEQSYDGSFNSYYDSKGQDYFFGGVRDIFEADDMTLINLECVLSDATERVEKRWNLKGKPGYIGIMTGSSIEACSLGNNHTYDYGQAGLDDTRNVLDNAGVVYGFNDHTGIYETADGTRIGIVSVSLLSQNGDREAYIQNGIAQLREQGAAIVIACCHWGIEGDHYPNDYQQAAAHRIIDWGADLVVAHEIARVRVAGVELHERLRISVKRDVVFLGIGIQLALRALGRGPAAREQAAREHAEHDQRQQHHDDEQTPAAAFSCLSGHGVSHFR